MDFTHIFSWFAICITQMHFEKRNFWFKLSRSCRNSPTAELNFIANTTMAELTNNSLCGCCTSMTKLFINNVAALWFMTYTLFYEKELHDLPVKQYFALTFYTVCICCYAWMMECLSCKIVPSWWLRLVII